MKISGDPRSLAAHAASPAGEGRQPVRAPVPGEVTAGQGVAVVEAMKMQNEMKAPKSGRLVGLRVRVREGDTVTAGEVLAEIE